MDATPPPDDPFTRSDVAVAWCADPDGALTRSLRRRGAERPVIAPSRPAPDKRVHVARHLLRTLAPLGVPVDDGPLRVPPIMALEEMRRQAAADLACAGIVGPYAVVHPGSGSPAKNWPPERFAEVIELLATDHGLPTLLLAGPAEGEIVARLQARLTRPAPILTDRPLVVLAEILRAARLFLGNDSGLSHLAGIVGAPSLVLFGPSDPALWTPLGDQVRVLSRQPLGELPADQVLRALPLSS
jgi:heptosyltransferase-3